MQTYDIYNDIAKRTKGDIYVGVVGPVRTGKSTFIKRFMDELVLDSVSDSYALAMHIDTDEANAAKVGGNCIGEILD